jgi:hypothetical protein
MREEGSCRHEYRLDKTKEISTAKVCAVCLKQSRRKEAVVGRKTDCGQSRKEISTGNRCAVCFKQNRRKEAVVGRQTDSGQNRKKK